MTTKLAIICYVAAFGLCLLTISTARIWPLTSNDFLGIVSKLPVYFWVSIVVVYFGLVLSYNKKHTPLFLIGVISLVAILFIVPAVLEPYGRHPVSYGETGLSQEVVNGGFSGKIIPWLSMPYLAYQLFPMFITLIQTITNLSGVDLIRFFPALSVLLLSLMFFVLTKKISKNIQVAYLSVMLLIPLFYWHVFLVPELLSFLLLLAFFIAYEISEYRPSRSSFVIVLITLVGLTLVHIIAPLMAIIFLGVKSLFSPNDKRKHAFKYFILSIIVYVGFMTFVAYKFFEQSLWFLFLSYKNWDSLVSSLSVGQVGTVVPFERLFLRYVTLVPFATSFILAVLAVVALFLKRKHLEYSTGICLLLSSLLLLAIPYGNDMSLIRTAEFVILGTSFLTALLLTYAKHIRNRRLTFLKVGTIIVPFIFLLLQPIAYSGVSATTDIPLTELTGTHFFANTIPGPYVTYFAQSSQGIINYQNPDMAYSNGHGQLVFSLWYPPIRQFNLSDGFDYILHDQRDDNGLISYLGYDPVVNASPSIIRQFNSVYDNGYFWIYSRV